MPDAREIHGVAESLSWMRCRPSATDLASLAASGSSGGFSAAHAQKEAMSAARSAEIRESARPDSMGGVRAAAARRRFSAGVEGGSGFDMRSFYRGAGQGTEKALSRVSCGRDDTVLPTARCRRLAHCDNEFGVTTTLARRYTGEFDRSRRWVVRDATAGRAGAPPCGKCRRGVGEFQVSARGRDDGIAWAPERRGKAHHATGL